MKIFFKLFLLIFSFLTISIAKAEYFYIEDYDIDLKVGKNKIVNINENIDVFFTEARHGIFRTIPTKNTIIYKDGTQETLKAKIRNIYINRQYSTIYTGDSVEYKIGNLDALVSGKQNYNIKYDYVIPKSKNLKGKDEFYFNIIGNGWNTDIKKVHFKIAMPDKFDPSKIGFSIGQKGQSGYNSNELKYMVYGNYIEGNTLIPLSPNEGLTLRLELPEGYFEYQASDQNKYFKMFSPILFILTLITFILWFTIGKDEQIIPVINFSPPNNMNSAILGTYYREKSDDKDIVAMILGLASRGYIEIECNQKEIDKVPELAKKIIKNSMGYDTVSADNTIIRKLKDYNENDALEHAIMTALFQNNQKETTMNDLLASSEYYGTCLEIKKELDKKSKKLYNENSTGILSNFIPFMSVLFSIFVLFYSTFNYDLSFFSSDNNMITLLFPIVAILILVTNFKNNPVFITIWSLGFGGIPLAILYSELGGFNFDKLSVMSIICLVINIICLKNMPKKSKVALKLLGKIEGFKKFLETAEKHRIELLTKENPTYCFDILPYAYVLGISDVFIGKFEKFISSKYWKGNNVTLSSFKNCTNSFYQTTQPSTSNGGVSKSSGGGGSSGGGCGGGGGGSW